MSPFFFLLYLLNCASQNEIENELHIGTHPNIDIGEATAPPAVRTLIPSLAPSPEPTGEPTTDPTVEPTLDPTLEPTPEPTDDPTLEPTPEPTAEPSPEPTRFTFNPSTAPTVHVRRRLQEPPDFQNIR